METASMRTLATGARGAARPTGENDVEAKATAESIVVCVCALDLLWMREGDTTQSATLPGKYVPLMERWGSTSRSRTQ
eukprot:2594706-Prymnesium_polylepis.1